MLKSKKWLYFAPVALAGAGMLHAQTDLSFSDPSRVKPAPAWAVGQVSRTPDLDVLPGFQKPPPGFGNVPFFWWLGDPLTRERLTWELDQLSGMGICGLQINYAHTDKGGHSYGLTIPSEPPLFSENWWELTGWFMKECKQRGIGISLSDYTLGAGQGWCVDDMLRENPTLTGMHLRFGKGNPPADALATAEVTGTDGKKQKVYVSVEKVPFSYDPMNPLSGPQYVKKFFGKFEDRFPGEGGKGLNFFFSDELSFGVSGHLWNSNFAGEFKRRKGYDIMPELHALFMDIGPRTPKVRMDYSDVMVSLTEEHFWKPIFDWHQERGMTMGCDHGGRGRNVVEFGDYFRTQRWNQGPGSDQPGLGKDLIKAKVASSIAHLYNRPRVWLEGYYGSGWGTTSAGVVDATFADFLMGYNLLSFHGCYYSTHGGWWEWAPPCNTFHMPYWKQMSGFMDCVQRLSYLLSQGDHRCDVAILYPVAPMEAGMDGRQSVNTAFETARRIYSKGIDFDFMDFQSLARATVKGRELQVSGETYRVLVLPSMKAVRHSTLQKAVEFKRAGGVVLAIGALPEASDRMGLNDPEVAAMVRELFPNGPDKDVNIPVQDYEGPGYVMHRRLGQRDLYAVYNVPAGTLCKFRTVGSVELWDPWTGAMKPLPVASQRDGITEISMPLSEQEIQLVMFSPGAAEMVKKPAVVAMTSTTLDGLWDFELQPLLDNRFGDFHWPPTAAKIGAEIRQLEYAQGNDTNGPWKKITTSFGPQFLKLGPVARVADEGSLKPDGQWKPYEFSWRWGIENDPGHQGYHGLKAEVHDEFIGLGKLRTSSTGTSYEQEGNGGSYYLWSTVTAPREMTAYAVTGGNVPAKTWVNGNSVTGAPLKLKKGANEILLRYDKPGRAAFVVSTKPMRREETGSFSQEACWIWYPGEKIQSERWFRKSFDLAKLPSSASLMVTCDNGYEAFLNGKKIGSGNEWAVVHQYDVTGALRMGSNEILVKGRNDGGDAGLIAELTAGNLHIVTDDSWKCSKTEKGDWIATEKIASFSNSLWYNHPQGPPRVENVMASTSEKPVFKLSPLAMSWWNNPDVLPFDIHPGDAVRTGWYRFMSPPGLRSMTLPIRGKVEIWAGGKELVLQDGKALVAEPVPGSVPVLMRVEHQLGFYGGAALLEPIKLECVAGQINLGDWSRTDGLLSYSGGAVYRKTVNLKSSTKAVLNLGNVACTAEVRVNGQLVGTKVAPPWKFDITAAVKPGENRIEVLVCNTLANHYTTIPTRYRGSTTSGLLGPVTIETQ